MIALHGFLGLPSDWDFLKPHFSVTAPPILSKESLAVWALQFNELISKEWSRAPLLIGYSMGGRLALEALKQNPSLYKAAVLISTHPGLTSEIERQARLNSDKHWALAFQTMTWKALMEKWEAQAVFNSSSFKFRREEKSYSRQELINYLNYFSLGHQSRSPLPDLPILWITGQKDLKFTQLAEEVVRSHKLSKHKILEGSHRCVFEYPEKFVQSLKSENFF